MQREQPTSATDRAIIRVIDVVKRYGEADEAPALAGVSLDVRAGEMTALVGPSGCGKSTLLNLVGCVDIPTAGRVEIDGRATSDLDDDGLTALRRTRVGTIFQFFNLLPAMTIAENVGLPLVLARRPRAEIARRVAVALGEFGIAERADAYPGNVSGGQMQRAAVARAVIHAPAILLADEPTGNLDSQNGTAVLALLRRLADGGQAILMATHSNEAAAICDRIVRMQDGRIVAA